MSVLLEMKNIHKTFPGVKALDNVQLNVRAGEVHILLGENGAGKSTLMKILAGVYQADKGTIYIEGKQVDIKSPKDAQKHGIGIIFQEFNLIPHLSVAENIFFGRVPRFLSSIVNRKKLFEDTTRILNELQLDISPKTLVKDLGVAEQQMVEIAKAFSINSKILIMDEPTAALTEQEIDKLFERIHDLKKKGVGIIYISHRLEEFARIADRVTIMRDGRYVTTVDFDKSSIDELIGLMVGRSLEDKFPKDTTIKKGREILRVENLSTKDKLKKVSFSLHAGEILGISGLMGSGRTELARAIFGADPISEGQIYIDGEKVKINSPREAIERGISYLSEDRKKNGVALNLSIRENITMANLKVISSGGVINQKHEINTVEEFIKNLNIKTPSMEQKVKFLSGGNQQKVIIAKWLHTKAKIFIFDEPTRGIDVGAKIEVYQLINKLAREGNAVIIISSEMPEILGLSDRILVMNDGKCTAILDRKEATQEKVMYYATTGQ
ncbi:sugar ABC transporter ATP-binding protein [Parageobacillus sp. VR-IP]|uniref:sugar ABC transporter ATP-binding protein n=1 Tax=Parageobacillus sp. VR-IP TaxID=2742205 RepID=UPI001C2FC83C|nr:sugar ABC transporter ATP-binding protein [Parageobacillus sp. VR-IP]